MFSFDHFSKSWGPICYVHVQSYTHRGCVCRTGRRASRGRCYSLCALTLPVGGTLPASQHLWRLTVEHLNMWTYLNVNISKCEHLCEHFPTPVNGKSLIWQMPDWWKSYSEFFQMAELGILQPSCEHLKLKRDFCDLYFTEHHNPVVNILLVWRFCWCDISCGEHLKHLLAPIVNISTKWKSAK